MPTMCVLANTIVNQLTIARAMATAPTKPPSPPIVIRLLPREATPRPIPPTRIRCGIARMNRNAVVSRFRFVCDGSTLTETGYGMEEDEQLYRNPGIGARADRGVMNSDRETADCPTKPRFPRRVASVRGVSGE